MCTVPNASGVGWDRRFDRNRRRDEYADVFATASVRAEVEACAALARRGLVDVRWIAELVEEPALELERRVRVLDREGLRDAYALLFLEEPLLIDSVRFGLSEVRSVELPMHVVDAVSEVVGAVTEVEGLATAWSWFLNGDDDSSQ